MRQDRRTRNGNLPMSSRPPIQHLNRPYGLFTRRHRCGRLKFETAKVSQMQKVEKTYRGRAGITQPCGNHPKRAYKVIGPRRQHGRTKIESIKVKIKRFNDKKQQNVERTHLGRENAAQPPRNGSKRLHRVHRTRRRHGRIKFIPINVNGMETSGNAYLGRGNAIQPIWRPGKQIRRVSKLTIECRMPGEPWRDVEDYG